MKVRVKGKVLIVKEKDGVTRAVLSQINDAGFQELVVVRSRNGKGVLERGKEVELEVNMRAVVGRDGRAFMMGWM